jgi:hypothetical protein
VGSPASIFATRDWLDCIAFAKSVCFMPLAPGPESLSELKAQPNEGSFLIAEARKFLRRTSFPAFRFEALTFLGPHRRILPRLGVRMRPIVTSVCRAAAW